jgi:hypothetical protein
MRLFLTGKLELAKPLRFEAELRNEKQTTLTKAP